MSNNYLTTYYAFRKKQIEKATEFYKDPFTDKIPEYNKIAFVHTYCIGGTVDSQILGVNHYQSKHDAYDNMINFKEHENKFVFARGKFLEPFVAEQFTVLTRRKHIEGITLDGSKFGCDWSFSQIDYQCIDKDGITVPLEIKVSTVNYKDEDGDNVWGKGCEFNARGELLVEDDQIPMEYYIQCQKQMWLYGAEYMYLCAWLTFETKVRVFKITRNEKVITEIIEAEKDFLFNHVIPRLPYEEVDNTLKDTTEDNLNAVYADEDFEQLYNNYQEVNRHYNTLKKQNDALSKEIKERMGNYDMVVDSTGKKLCSLSKITSKGFDLEKFKNEQADLYKEYLTTAESTRLTVTKRKDNE